MRQIFLLMFTQLTISVCLAHELWLEEDREGYIVQYGHLNPSGGEERYVRYNPKDILDIKCFNVDGKEVEVEVLKGYPTRIVGKCHAMLVTISTGFWTKTPYGLKNSPKDETPQAIESWLSFETIKKMGTFSDRVYTGGLEIVPLRDFSNLKVGDKVTFSVFLERRPLKDVVVNYNGRQVGTTDEEGRINIRIKQSGQQFIKTSYRVKSDGIKSDFKVYTSTLNFEVRQ